MVVQGRFYGIFASLSSFTNIFNMGEYQIVRHLWKDYFAKATNHVVEEEKQDLSIINILPEELLIEILARLPVKSLLRFRSVSKSWRDMLKEPTFITKHHLTQVALSHGNCVFINHRNFEKPKTIKGFGLLTEDELGIKFTNLELPYDYDYDIDDVVCPCNGLVLVYCRRYGGFPYKVRDNILVWNPARREYKLLPPPTPVKTKRMAYSCVGFGIDPITKDFKVVRIWEYVGKSNNGNICYRAEVISLSATSCMPKCESWKTINAPPYFPVRETDHLYFNGKYYWSITKWFDSDSISFDSCQGRKIMWFDMGAEVFGMIELPYLCSNPYWNRLGVLNGSLAMIRHAYMTEEKKYMYEIWIMDECDGVSWKKYANIGPFTHAQYPLGFWKDEELVVNVFNESRSCGFEFYRVASYDIKTNMMKKRRQGLYVENSPTPVMYSESLVSVVGED